MSGEPARTTEQRFMHNAPSRREFLRTAAFAGATIGVAGVSSPLISRALAQPAKGRGLKVLVLGGTGQTGPHLVEELKRRGHTVTLFNRGNRSDDLFPDVECLIGDRTPDAGEGLKALEDAVAEGRKWDVCIDVWPHIPKIVENTAVLLKDNVGQYMFVSSVSVYASHGTPHADETDAVGEAPNADETEYNNALFGPFKAECENRVRRIYPNNHAIFRPGLIVGPRDFSFRGGYWPVRVNKGGEVLAPGTGDDPIQVIDARDLVAFQVTCMERRTNGTFNVVGPQNHQKPLSMREYLEACRKGTNSNATFTWVDAEFLQANGVGPWMNMPCWIPAEGDYAGFGLRSNARAIAAGLTFRPLTDTARDTVEWYESLADEQRESVTRRAGIPAEKEQEVLAAWHAREAVAPS
jgi:2'-hydroxyisoflavone reductase